MAQHSRHSRHSSHSCQGQCVGQEYVSECIVWEWFKGGSVICRLSTTSLPSTYLPRRVFGSSFAAFVVASVIVVAAAFVVASVTIATTMAIAAM